MTTWDQQIDSRANVAAVLEARRGSVATAVRVAVLLAPALASVGVPASVSHADPAGAPAGSGRGAAAVITAGDEYSCARLGNGTVKCWGLNFYGQLGQGDTSYRGDGPGEMGNNLAPIDLGTGRTATAITAGRDHTCAVLDDGAVKCWGHNVYGQLGQGDDTSRGDNAGEMGDNLAPVDLGTGRTATAITAGEQHTCALLDVGTVKCWGHNFAPTHLLADVNGHITAGSSTAADLALRR